jgi:hypothetical protein
MLDVQRELLALKELVRVRVLLPGSSAYERGITGLAERLGPNGRVLSAVAVVCATGAMSRSAIGVAESNTLYHRIAASRAAESDQTFKRDLMRMLRGAPMRDNSPMECDDAPDGNGMPTSCPGGARIAPGLRPQRSAPI